MPLGLLPLPRLLKGPAELVLDHRLHGRLPELLEQREGLLVTPHRLRQGALLQGQGAELALDGADAAQVVDLADQRQGRLIGRPRLVESALLRQHSAQVYMQPTAVPLDLPRLLQP